VHYVTEYVICTPVTFFLPQTVELQDAVSKYQRNVSSCSALAAEQLLSRNQWIHYRLRVILDNGPPHISDQPNILHYTLCFPQINLTFHSHLCRNDPIGYFLKFPYSQHGPGSSVGIATDDGLDGPWSNPGGDEIFRPSRPALEPTQLPVQWVPDPSRG